MKYIDRITASAKQRFTLATIDEGQTITCELTYLTTQRNWVIDVSWQEFSLKGISLGLSPNLLRQWKNVIPFGFALLSVDGFDPYYLQDFSSGRCKLYLLSRAEAEEIEQLYITDAESVDVLVKAERFILTEQSGFVLTESDRRLITERDVYV